MEEMKMISFDDFQDKYIGKIGTPQEMHWRSKLKKPFSPINWGKLSNKLAK